MTALRLLFRDRRRARRRCWTPSFQLIMALLLAIVVVYMIMASIFESLVHPFTIMISVVLALAGGIFTIFVVGAVDHVAGAHRRNHAGGHCA